MCYLFFVRWAYAARGPPFGDPWYKPSHNHSSWLFSKSTFYTDAHVFPTQWILTFISAPIILYTYYIVLLIRITHDDHLASQSKRTINDVEYIYIHLGMPLTEHLFFHLYTSCISYTCTMCLARIYWFKTVEDNGDRITVPLKVSKSFRSFSCIIILLSTCSSRTTWYIRFSDLCTTRKIEQYAENIMLHNIINNYTFCIDYMHVNIHMNRNKSLGNRL